MKKFILGSVLLGVLAVAPSVSFAKDNENTNVNIETKAKVEMSINKNENKNDSQDKNDNQQNNDKMDRGCFRAFGHLIAPGWIKHNGAFDLNQECHFPFGIGKKEHDENSTSTQSSTSTVALSIANVNFKVGTDRASVLWNTNVRSEGTVFIGTTTPVSTSSTSTAMVIEKNRFSKNHEVTFKNLTASTTYYVVIRARVTTNSAAFSQTLSFTTKMQPATSTTPIDVTAPVIHDIVTTSSTSSANVTWKTNEPATSQVIYSKLLATTTLSAGTTTLTKDHSVTISALATSTPYQMIIKSTDAAGNTAISAQMSLTTGI